MKQTKVTFLSSDGKTSLQGWLWEPEGTPKAILQIAHGISEHMGRYQEFARYFTDRGYVVAGHDHLGHGGSLSKTDPLPAYFGSAGSWSFVVEDIRACSLLLKQQFPGLPLCLLGFSLGSFAVRCLLPDAPELAKSTIWIGTGQTTAIERAIAGAIVRLEQRRFGDTTGTPLLQKLTMDSYNQHFRPCRTRSDWLCADPAAVDRYLADPLCGDGFTVGSFRELLTGMKQSSIDALVARIPRDLPILLLSGKDDPVGNFGKGVEAVCKQLEAHQFQDVQMQLFDGMRHDILRETEALSVFQTMENWLETRLA